MLVSLNKSLDNSILSSTFSILLLTSSNIHNYHEAIEYLLPHVEATPTVFFSLLNPLCSILENHLSKVSNLHKSKMEGLSVFLQLALSMLYVLLKNYKDPSKILVVYGNCLLGYTQASKIEVQSAACLCFSTFFNEKSIEILPFLHTYIDSVLLLCENNEEVIINCGVSCLGSVIMSSEEFLSPYVLRIIDASCKLSNNQLNKIIANHIPHRTLIEKLSQSLESAKGNTNFLTCLFDICKNIGEKVSINDLNILKNIIFEFYQGALTVICLLKSKDIDKLSNLLGQSFALFALNFTNSQLKPGFLEIFQWSLEKTEEEDYNYHRFLAFTNLVLNLTIKLKKFFIPYYSHFFEVFLDLISRFGTNFSSSKRKNSKNKIKILLNSQIHSCLQQLAVNDSEKFLTSDKYDNLSEAVSNQFKCIYIEKYSIFCEKNLIPTIIAFLFNTGDQSIWQTFTYKVLLQTRSLNKEVRFQALTCVSKALSKIGKEYAGLIGDIMPFVLEGLEDTDDAVTSISKTLLSQLESFCGEEIRNYIS